MEPNELNEVVNTLADRLGIAAEKLVPVSEMLVREVVLRNWTQAGIFLVVAMALGYLALRCYRSGNAVEWDIDGVHAGRVLISIVGGLVASLVAFLAVAIEVVPGVTRALWPTLALLESLR